MVRADAGLGQAEGDVDGGVEVEELERDEALIVIHGEDCVVVALGGIAENRIGHGGTSEGGEAGGV